MPAGAPDGPRARGNALFKAGDFAGAAAAYSEGLQAAAVAAASKQLQEDKAALLSNRAACYLELGDMAAAAEDARACLLLQPCNAKAYFRLARALPRDDPGAAPAVAAAVALLPANARSGPVLQLYREVREAAEVAREAAAQKGQLLLQLPEDVRLIFCVTSSAELISTLSFYRPGGLLVVLHPGTYETISLVLVPWGSTYTLLGLGAVELRASGPCGHAVKVMEGVHATLVNVRIVGDGTIAAACVSNPRSMLRMVRCRVEDYSDVAVLVLHEGEAALYDCVFSRLPRQAIEVRKGGSLTANQLLIQDCHQGISVYGGARLLLLQNSTILRCRNEGLLISGTYMNASTDRMAAMLLDPEELCEQAEAAAWAEEHGIGLQVTILHCTIAHCGQFGISADNGACLALQQCRLEYNDPFSVLVRGSTDTSIIACQLLYSGAASISEWDGSFLKPARQGAIEVAINYGGTVEAVGNAFVGPKPLAFVEAYVCGDLLASRRAGLWSKPVLAQKNVYLQPCDVEHIPSVTDLAQRLPARLRGSIAAGDVPLTNGMQAMKLRLAPPPASALLRPCRSFQQAGWSPTTYQFYAIGNTLGYDLTGGLLPPGVGSARLLFGACGDIRNLLATVHAVTPASNSSNNGSGSGSSGSGSSSKVRLSCVMNDGNLSMLARNAALLHLAVNTEASAAAAAGVVLAVWANHCLSREHSAQLTKSLEMLAEEAWPAWLSAAHSLDGAAGAGEAEAALRGVFRAWASCSMHPRELLAQRNSVIGAPLRSRAEELSMTAVQASLGKAQGEELRKGVAAYVEAGSLLGDGTPAHLPAINPTFLIVPELQYAVCFSSSIFRAVPLQPGGTAHAGLLATLAPQLDSVVEALRGGSLTLKLVPGDILAAMTAQPAVADMAAADVAVAGNRQLSQLFDFIDCSNVADYVSLPSMVQAATPLLSRKPHARLRVESIVGFEAELVRSPSLTPGDFAASHLGVPLPIFEELLGLRLAGAQRISGLTAAVRMEWAVRNFPGPSSSSWLTAPFLLLELLSACKRYINFVFKGSTYGQAAAFQSAPLALMHLLVLAVPQRAEAMIHALLRCDTSGQAALCRWELTMHAQIHAGRCPPLRCMKYQVEPELWLLRHIKDSLVLAISKVPLSPGPQAGNPAIKQLISSFVWDEEHAAAYWLLPESLAERRELWHVTLCRVDSSQGLIAAGTPAQISSLPTRAPPTVTPWRGLPADLHRQNTHLDFTLVDQAGSGTPPRGRWQSAVHSASDGSVTVDVLAPGPLPSAEAAAMTAVTVTGSQGVTVLRVCVKSKQAAGGKQAAAAASDKTAAAARGAAAAEGAAEGAAAAAGGGAKPAGDTAAAAVDDVFEAELPPGVEIGMPLTIKISRKLGLLSALILPHEEAPAV